MKGSFEILGSGLTCVEVRIAHRAIVELKSVGATEFSVTFEARRPSGTIVAGEQRVPIERMPQPGKETASCKNRTRSYERNDENTL